MAWSVRRGLRPALKRQHWSRQERGSFDEGDEWGGRMYGSRRRCVSASDDFDFLHGVGSADRWSRWRRRGIGEEMLAT